MSSDWASCDLCKYRWYELDEYIFAMGEWMWRIRAIYPIEDTFRLSGVLDVASLTKPLSATISFPVDDHDSVQSTGETVAISIEDPEKKGLQDPYLIHDSCWEILRRFFDGPIPWKRLVVIFDGRPAKQKTTGKEVAIHLSVEQLLELEPKSSLAILPLFRRSRLRTGGDFCIWKSTLKRDPKRPFHEIKIPCQPTVVVISFFSGGPQSFITGLRFLSRKEVISVGCILPDSPIIPIQGMFQGFQVATTGNLVQGIQVIVDRVASSWVGEASATSTIDSLTLLGGPQKLQASFLVSMVDRKLGCITKLISETRPGFSEVPVFEQERPFIMASLSLQFDLSRSKDTTLPNDPCWIPTVPPSMKGLYFNRVSFHQANPTTMYDWTTSWMLFGEQDGGNLRHLTKIEVWAYKHRLTKIYFTYSNRSKVAMTEFQPTWHKGPCGVYNWPGEWCLEDFKIDGRGGERISKIIMVSYEYDRGYSQVTPLWYEIYTNWGRSFQTCTPSRVITRKKDKSLRRRVMAIVPKTTPVGFYGFKRGSLGQLSLGVITARVEE
ncbi:F-box domain containing protein [Penicillium capsulatum]|uniref:F-box domain containing protein n=1 Tax=Penicillium capsulatum TaxID=69766 RepID=A0A9W9ISY6_9EURO|nr:F-box domain containing protein [Penicillium capsulatum]KAJ6130798.1 F-box domain containing protein [Penicillium capsulatum]